MTKSLMWLLGSVLKDTSTRCGTDTHRDYLTVSRRIKHEGVSFLTIALPNFCRDFERSLDEGKVDTSRFLGFRRHGALPAFLRGLLCQVFDPGSGLLLDEPSEESILCIRQVCLMFKKIELPCSQKRTRQTFEKYVEVERELAGSIEKVSKQDFDDFGRLSDLIWSETLSPVVEKLLDGDIRPNHGPGATAERINGNAKYRLKTWHKRLELWFPFIGNGDTYSRADRDPELRSVQFAEPDAETPSRVVSVPKTLSGPRVIAIEPVCMQYTQQGILKELVRVLERKNVRSTKTERLEQSFTAGHLNFSDQRINRDLALDASRGGTLLQTGEVPLRGRQGGIRSSFATIDLKDASDRVHKDFVYRMLRSVPDLRDAIFACRTQSASLPSGDVLPLYKFASMGSALCFPVEAMMFYTLCILARLRFANKSLTRRNAFKASRRVYVYGDDILVPANEVPTVISLLEAFSLKVSLHKTFATGRFRESCGMDAYNGVNVTPVYARSMPPCNRQDASAIVSYVSLSNQLYKAGFWGTASRVREFVESVLNFRLPLVRETSSCLGWHTFHNAYQFQGYTNDTQAPKVRSYGIRVVEQDDPLTDYPALMKFFLKVGDDPIQGKHLERTVLRGSVNIKIRWAQPF